MNISQKSVNSLTANARFIKILEHALSLLVQCLVVQFPATCIKGFDSSVIMPFSWCVVVCDTSYIVSVHIQCQAFIYTFVVSRAFMAGAASQTGDADSSRAPGLTSGLQGLSFVP